MDFMSKHNNMRKNWDFPAHFPDAAVVEAYILPRVDTSMEKFTWARPDVELLRLFCEQRLGWQADKIGDLLNPVIERYEAKTT